MRLRTDIYKLRGFLLIVALCFSGCGGMNTKSEMNDGFDSNRVEASELTLQRKQLEKKYLPDLDYLVQTPYYYACYDISNEKVAAYKKQLEQNGVVRKKQEIHSEIPYDTYENDTTRILMVELEEAILLSTSDSAKTEEYEGEPSFDCISTAIQEEYENLCISDPSMKAMKPEVFLTCQIDELYQKTNMLAIQTFTKEGKKSGIYLVSNNKACRIMDSLENICIADIDQDGKSELLSLFGFGSGIYRINLNVYKYGNPLYFNSNNEVVYCCYSNCYVPQNGYKELAFLKINETEVHLVEAIESEDFKEKKEIGIDYGKIITSEESFDIGLENTEKFPFYEWDECYGTLTTDIRGESKKE